MARQRFTGEFKREAVRLLERGDTPVSQLALALGIPRNRLYKWRDAIAAGGDLAFRGSGRRSPQQQELAQLRRQVMRLGQENEILKKWSGTFSLSLGRLHGQIFSSHGGRFGLQPEEMYLTTCLGH